MKKSASLVLTLSLLTGCQTLNDKLKEQSEVTNTAANDNLASPLDISEALANSISEPVEADEPAPIFDDVWERIRFQLSIPVIGVHHYVDTSIRGTLYRVRYLPCRAVP